MTDNLPQEWLDGLGLARRRRPELFLRGEDVADSPHAGALRIAFEDMDLAAVFCIEGVPTVGFLVSGEISQSTIDEVHWRLWNQGLMTLLVVLDRDVLRAYSLSRLPQSSSGPDVRDRRLVAELSRVADALELKDLILGIESGRWWEHDPTAFDPSERVDRILLENLMSAFRQLRDEGLPPDAAQALLMQTMFVAYLEDRGVIGASYFQEATGQRVESLASLLETRGVDLLDSLFERLKRDFNGDVFLAPCAFEPTTVPLPVQPRHFDILRRFREGREVMTTGQLRFWVYNFRYIPVELLSAVYDRFLEQQDPEMRRKEGAYYTPMFLVDMVVSQVWDLLDDKQRDMARVLDPACGSGIFLVRLFQRIAEHKRTKLRSAQLGWDELRAIAERLHGRDINPSALRIAVFSLYLALLEQVTPPDIQALMKQGRLLPLLWDRILIPRSFFEAAHDGRYDLVLGNPPWTSRRGDTGGAQQWCDTNKLPCPSDEAAWAFVWKAERSLAPQGIAALLLPAMGMLHNHSQEAVEARRRLLDRHHVERIVNFSDMTFQLFDGADRPTALVMFRGRSARDGAYRFDYWCPKADLNLRLKRVLTLNRSDQTRLRSDLAAKEPRLFKRRLWMRSPDEKLWQYLTVLPRLGDLLDEFGGLMRRHISSKAGWVIGQGFKPVKPSRLEDPRYSTTNCEQIAYYPFLQTDAFRPLALPIIGGHPWRETLVHRAGFVDGFAGPHILIPQGVERKVGRLRAAYTEQSLTFRHSIQAIAFPVEDRPRAKLLTAILNSKLVAWFVFHQTANLGTDRAKVHQTELLDIPFPSPHDVAHTASAELLADKIIGVVDAALAAANDLLVTPRDFIGEIDQLVFEYFGLTKDEIAVVEDTLTYLIPAMQPREGTSPPLWRRCERPDRDAYAEVLARALQGWLLADTRVDVALVGIGADLAVLRLRLVPASNQPFLYEEASAKILETEMSNVLARIWEVLPTSLPGNFQVIPDLRVFLDGDMYLVKPRQLRYWLRSSALADADEIAADLHGAFAGQAKRTQVLNAGR